MQPCVLRPVENVCEPLGRVPRLEPREPERDDTVFLMAQRHIESPLRDVEVEASNHIEHKPKADTEIGPTGPQTI